MLKKKKWVKALGFLPFAVATPIIATACGSINHEKFLTNYDNALDAALSFGIAPDYYLSNTYKYENGKYSHAPYLDEYLNTDLTEIKDLRIYDGSETDLKSLSKLEPYAMLVNEWERVDEAQYDGVVSHMMYTSMGDTLNARFTSSDSIDTTGYAPDTSMTRFYQGLTGTDMGEDSVIHYKDTNFGVSPQKALSMAAKDIDKVYNTGGIFEKRASEINKLTEERIKAISNDEYFKAFLKATFPSSDNGTSTIKESSSDVDQASNGNITVGIITGGASNDASSFKLLTPNALPTFYSSLNGRGLGFNFPTPSKEILPMNTTTYDATYIKADTADKTIQAFTGKFDYLIYYTTVANSDKKLDEKSKTEFKKMLKKGTASAGQKTNNATDDNRFFESTYFNIYGPIWGMMGISHLLNVLIDDIIPQFYKPQAQQSEMTDGSTSSTYQTLQTKDIGNRISFPTKDVQSQIRKTTDFSSFKEWDYTPKQSSSQA